MVSEHRRFELLDVMLGGQPIGRCTIDEWLDQRGDRQWTARVLMTHDHGSTSGQLEGRTREGSYLAGPAMFAAHQEGPRGARNVLVQLNGTGPLVRTIEPPATGEGL